MENNEVKKIYTPFELFGTEGLSKSGWGGLVQPFLHEVKLYNKDKEEDKKAHITQVKEKWAQLCLYGAYPEHIQRQVDMAEEASAHICMECGSPFLVGQTQNGWITTLCEECAKKQDKIDDWKLRYTSVRLDKFLSFYLKLRSKYWKLKKKVEHINYKLFQSWKYKRIKTFNKFKQLLFWEYVGYKKYDWIPLYLPKATETYKLPHEIKFPPLDMEVLVETNKRGWEGHYKATFDGVSWVNTKGFEFNKYVHSNTEGEEIVIKWKKIKEKYDM